MAIAISEPIAESIATTNASSYALGAFTPTASSLLVVFAFVPGGATTCTISGGSLTWNLLYMDTALDLACIWYAQVSASPASTTITVTPDLNGSGISLSVFQFTGHDTTGLTPIKQVKKGNTTSTNPRVNLDYAMDTNNGYCAAFMSNLGGSAVSTPPTSWTETSDSGFVTPTRNSSGAFRAGGETTSTVTFTMASSQWICAFVEVYVSGAAPLRKSLTGIGVG